MWGDIQDIFLFGCPKTIDITGFFKKFCIATRTRIYPLETAGFLFYLTAADMMQFAVQLHSSTYLFAQKYARQKPFFYSLFYFFKTAVKKRLFCSFQRKNAVCVAFNG